ncbi:MAG: Smr/MutS family protein [Patescibacteria group bacterium]|jgi:DNA-nicking Smr family endonuclease
MRESFEAALFAAELGEAPTVDLHGMDVQTARHALDEFLQQSFMRRESAVRIIHGRGTDALRHAVEKIVSSHEIVEGWRGSTRPDEAGAVTYAALSKRP